MMLRRSFRLPLARFNARRCFGYLKKKKGKKSPYKKAAAEAVPQEYDLVVIGGGSGGLAASREAVNLGKKVALCDYVDPSPQGNKWGLGGTCVNVGCIPKKLFHRAALMGEALPDMVAAGWDVDPEAAAHNWQTMVEKTQTYIQGLNWGYRVSLQDQNVEYLNAKASFVDPHTVQAVDAAGGKRILKAEHVLVATGCRPRFPDIPGAVEYGITSDDVFMLPKPPGRTLVIGASYVALECAGFLTGLGFDTTVMARSIFLRGFDQDMAERAGNYMMEHGTRVMKGFVPTAVEAKDGVDGKKVVSYRPTDGGDEIREEFDTVLFAIGRDGNTKGLNLEEVGVKTNPISMKVVGCGGDPKRPADVDAEQSSVPHIFAIGDALDGRPELTPVAIGGGKMLMKRLYGGGKEHFNYDLIPTSVFTPLEYGCIGLPEEVAIECHGEENLEVYHSNFKPLEWVFGNHENNACYCKVITDLKDNERILGIHYLGPNAGEVIQGYALGMTMNATFEDWKKSLQIHPTTSEELFAVNITKRSGKSPQRTGC